VQAPSGLNFLHTAHAHGADIYTKRLIPDFFSWKSLDFGRHQIPFRSAPRGTRMNFILRGSMDIACRVLSGPNYLKYKVWSSELYSTDLLLKNNKGIRRRHQQYVVGMARISGEWRMPHLCQSTRNCIRWLTSRSSDLETCR